MEREEAVEWLKSRMIEPVGIRVAEKLADLMADDLTTLVEDQRMSSMLDFSREFVRRFLSKRLKSELLQMIEDIDESERK